jgi:hypothetical protein
LKSLAERYSGGKFPRESISADMSTVTLDEAFAKFIAGIPGFALRDTGFIFAEKVMNSLFSDACDAAVLALLVAEATELPIEGCANAASGISSLRTDNKSCSPIGAKFTCLLAILFDGTDDSDPSAREGPAAMRGELSFTTLPTPETIALFLPAPAPLIKEAAAFGA